MKKTILVLGVILSAAVISSCGSSACKCTYTSGEETVVVDYCDGGSSSCQGNSACLDAAKSVCEGLGGTWE